MSHDQSHPTPAASAPSDPKPAAAVQAFELPEPPKPLSVRWLVIASLIASAAILGFSALRSLPALMAKNENVVATSAEIQPPPSESRPVASPRDVTPSEADRLRQSAREMDRELEAALRRKRAEPTTWPTQAEIRGRWEQKVAEIRSQLGILPTGNPPDFPPGSLESHRFQELQSLLEDAPPAE